MSVVERSALDVPELFELYFARLRRDYFARFARYVERRQREAAFRADVDPRTAGRFAIEAIVYFARHRFGDPDPGALELEEGAVRDDVVRLTAGALVADPPRSPRRRSR